MVSHINQALMPIVQEEVNFEDSAPSLFGSGFAKKSKELMDQLKAMRTSIPKKGSRDQHQLFFRKGPSTSRSGGANYQRFSGNQHKFRGNRGGTTVKSGTTTSPTKRRTIHRTLRANSNKYLKKCLRKYTVTTDSIHGRGPNSSSKTAGWKPTNW